MDRKCGHLRGNRGGNVPFTALAVTILVMASAYCAVSAMVQREDGSGTVDEVESLGESAENVQSYIAAGLGQIIFDVCTVPDLGDLGERSRTFRQIADVWMGEQFPMYCQGTKVDITGYEIDLRTERLRADGSEGGYTPSFLKAVGRFTAVFETESGSTTEEFTVATDGSCALPLSLEKGSLFENAVSGEGSVLSQMMNYQLTSLAQYRVINGYGAFSEFGNRGTREIITEQDVLEAYRLSLQALSCLYFRDGGLSGSVDLASMAVAEDGRITIDLNSVYAQALYSEMDSIVGKWFDYFLGNIAVQICDYISDALKNAWDSMVSFVTGRNNFSAEPYLRQIVGDLYTGLRTGQSFWFTVTNPEDGTQRSYQVSYPSVDLYGSDTVKNFNNHYRSNTNSIRDWISAVVNQAIVNIANGRGMGTVTLSVNDTGTFSDTVHSAITQALSGNMDSFENVTRDLLSSSRIPDQFYAAIYSEIYDNRDSIFCYGEGVFDGRIKDLIRESVRQDFSEEGVPLSDAETDALLDSAFSDEDNLAIYSAYRAEVGALLERLSALKSVEAANSSVIQRTCIGMLQAGFFALDCAADIKSVAYGMCQEFRTNLSVNPLSGFTEMPETDRFVLTGDAVYTERLSVSTASNPSVSVSVDRGRSVHQTGFGECGDAPFCTVFPVSLTDRLSFTVSSSGDLMEALGLSDSVYGDTITVTVHTEVAVVSGWGLVGVDYPSNTNILQDAYNLLLKALEPLLEPLRRIIHMAEEVMNLLSEAIMTVTQYINEIVQRIYDAIMGPIERIKEMIESNLTAVFCEHVVELIEGATAIVDVSAVNQIIGFTYMGFTLTFTFNLKTLENYTKYIVRADFSGNVNGVDITAFMNVKTKGEDKKTPQITGGFGLKGESWDLQADLDPTMAVNKRLMGLSGQVRGVRIDAVLPEAVQYNEVGISLQDIPGIGTILSNIPSPIAGTKVELDAGVNLKYSFPLVSGVLINEFESNPSGTDKDREWAEILNLTGSTVDLNNWTLTTSKGKVHIIKDLELQPGGRAVIHFPGTFLVNTKEYIILKDPDGVEIDRSATMSDGRNDDCTCQRSMDGSTEWGLIEGTEEAANKGGLLGTDGILAGVVKDIAKRAAVKAMTEMRHVYTTEDLQELLVRTVKYAVDDGINRIANCLVEGSVYVSVDFTDLASVNHTGFRIYLMVDKDLVGDILKFLLGKLEALFLNIEDPYNIDLGSVVYDDVYLGVSVYGGISAPKFLNGGKEFDGKVLLGADIMANLSAIGGLLGSDLGTPKVKAQVGIRNCPYELIPKALGVKKNMTYDLWFIRMTFTPA